jgi:lysozyme
VAGSSARIAPEQAPPRRFRAAALVRAVEAHYRKPVILYLTREFDQAYAVSASVNRRLWLRSLVLEPGFGARPWTLWQVSNFRRLDGISGRVDWNVARP